jgi:transcriptional regulator with GAF, ATPase, and Fis domain
MGLAYAEADLSAKLQPVLLDSRNPAMRDALVTAQQAGSCDANVLLTGESGTGKSVLAAAIHQWSARRDAAFVTVPFTSLGESLLANELFGHVKGAFTGAWKDKPGRLEAAHGGTLFFDEIGELPAEVQAKLLRFVEAHRFERLGSTDSIAVDARIIAATSRDLEADVRAGRFRPDLFFRLSVISIRLPPLRERMEDLPALTAHVLHSLRGQHDRMNLQPGGGRPTDLGGVLLAGQCARAGQRLGTCRGGDPRQYHSSRNSSRSNPHSTFHSYRRHPAGSQSDP